MRLTTKGRFAVTAMIDLALREHKGPVALAAISERQDISLSYLEQLFGKLRRHSIVESTRGPGGGYTTAQPLDNISVADIISAVDEEVDATMCGGKEDCHDVGRHGGGTLLTEAVSNATAALNATPPRTGLPAQDAQSIKVSGKCMTHDLWATLNQKVHDYLESVSLGDLVRQQREREAKVLGIAPQVLQDLRGSHRMKSPSALAA
jgi:Rrf2 family transcriptional regulator, iron-sulfur cluster assembly transcription factor